MLLVANFFLSTARTGTPGGASGKGEGANSNDTNKVTLFLDYLAIIDLPIS